MTDVNMSVVLYTQDDTTSIELMEATVPTMEAIRSKMDDIYAIISDWATVILEDKLSTVGKELTCELIVRESTNTVFNIVIMLNGATLTELPDEYIVEFDKGMPTLIGELYETLQLNFDVKFTATNYIASDMREELRNKVTGLTESYTLPATYGWYRIAYSAVGVKDCTGLFSIVTSGESISETIMFTVGTSYAQNGDTLQQIQRTRKGTDITRIRLLVNKTNYATTYAYVDIYKSSLVEEPIKFDVMDGSGFTLCDKATAVDDTVPSGYTAKILELQDGGMIASKLEGLDASVTELNYSIGVVGPIQSQIDSKAPKNHANSDGTVYGKSSATLYGHAKASSTTPLSASETPTAGTKTDEFARGDHAHPVQTTITGNAGTATALQTARKIGVSGSVTASAVSFNGTQDVDINITALNATKLNGLVPISSIPPEVMERLVIVENDTERFALTTDTVQNGDTVKVKSTQKMYFVVDSTQLNSEAGYEVYTAGSATSVDWSGIQNKPTSFTPSLHASTHASGQPDAITPLSIGAEPSFTKNDAFNKDFGTTSGTVCQGNDSRLSDARTPTTHAYTHKNNGGDRIIIDASQTTTGIFDIARIPAGAKERLVTVADDTARFALTTSDVQTGDSVYVTATEKLYIVIDDTKLSSESGYMQYRAYVSWESIDNKPSEYNPSAHASTHSSNGTDPITPESIGAEPTISRKSAFNQAFETTASNIKVAGTAAVGTSTNIPRADHVHPAQTSVSGNAGTATKLATARTIGISGGATGTATSFDGSGNITIPVTSLDITKDSNLTATVAELNYCDGVTSNIQTQLGGKAPTSHASTATTYGVSSASNYGHAMASSTTPKVAGTAAVGSETAKFARGDHVHPVQTSVSGNAGTATKLATARTIAISGGATGTATSFDGTANVTIPVTTIDATKLVGTIPESSVPQTAFVSVVTVADDTARFALTTNDVKKGDTVKVTATSTMYFVVDTSKLSTEAGYEPYITGSALSVPWSGITGKPSTFTPSSHASTATTYGVSSASNYGHSMASSTTPKAAGTAAVGSETAKFARGDHVHPAQTSVSGNAGTATKLAASKTIGISGGATGTATAFDGSDNITISVTALDESKLSSAVAIARGGTGATTAAGALTNLGLTATATELNYCDGVTSAIQTQLNGKAATSHASTATTYGAASASNYGHAMASSTTPKAAGTAAVGSETAKFARGDHVHPAQTSVSGNAGTATKLATARTIGISGGATGTATSFDGSGNITIPVTSLDESKLSSAVAIARGGTGATTAAGALTNLGVNTAIDTKISAQPTILNGTTEPTESQGKNGDIYVLYSD